MKNKKFRKTLCGFTLSLAVLCVGVFLGEADVKADEGVQRAALYQEENGLDERDKRTDDSQEWTLDANGTLTITGVGDPSTYYWADFDTKKTNVKKIIINLREVIWLSFSNDDFPNLESIDLSGCDGSQIEDLGSAFSGLKKLRTLIFGNFNTSNVTNMRCMFAGCSSLASLDLSKLNTENVTDMSGMFDMCTNLKEIDISNFDLSKITIDLDHTWISPFGECDGLEKITVPANLPEKFNFPYSSLGWTEGMEEYWKDTSGVEYETYAKAGLTVPMTYTRVLKEYGSSNQTPNGQTPTMQQPKPLPAGTGITDAAALGKYVVTSTNTAAFTGPGNASAKSVTIPDSVTYAGITYKVTAVNAKALRGNKKITGVKIGVNVTKIGDGAFENCTKLKNATVGSGVTSIGKNAFKGCKNLKKIQIKSTKITSVGKNAFKKIHKKCKIKVPSSKVKAYQKKMKGKGQAKSVKITK